MASGRVLHYAAPGYEELRLKLLVDESFDPPEPGKKIGEVDGPILRVTSGRLHLRGIDALSTAEGSTGENPGTGADDRVGIHPDEAEVAPGIYRVTALRLHHHLSPRLVEREIAGELQPGVAAYVRRVAGAAVPVGCGLVLVSILAASAFLFAAATWSWRIAAMVVALAGGVAAAVVAWRLLASPRMTRWNKAKDALWTRYPPVVVVLRRLNDDEVPAKFPPGRFGDAVER